MRDTFLLHHLLVQSAEERPDAVALVADKEHWRYGQLAGVSARFAAALVSLGVKRGERVGIYLDKSCEMVAACFGTAQAGAVFVPINPILKPEQVVYIMRDCNVRLLVTSAPRLQSLAPALVHCPDLRHLVITGTAASATTVVPQHTWADLQRTQPGAAYRVIDTDMVSILYTSGSTGKPKGVVLSHRNMVAGAKSVAAVPREQPGRHAARRAAAVV